MGLFRLGWRRRPVLRALRRRRQLRAGLVQLSYVAVALALGLAAPHVRGGPEVPSDRIVGMLVAISGGFITLIGIVFSLLFLVIQFGATIHTPRLTLFRDSPLVWHAFGLFVGVFVFGATAALAIGRETQVSVLVPLFSMLLVIVSLGVIRRLQLNAYRSVQLAPILHDVAHRGRAVLDALYAESIAGTAEATREQAVDRAELPDVTDYVYWPAPSGVLRQVDLPGLVRCAATIDGVLELTVTVGDVVWENDVVLVARGARVQLDTRAVRKLVEVGLERSLNQDLLLAFRLLVDIGLRALSPAVNDPATAIQALDSIEDLLRALARRRLDVGSVYDAEGTLRVVVKLPTWETYVAEALDELTDAAAQNSSVTRRIHRLLTDVATIAPPSRQAALAPRLRTIAERLDESVVSSRP
jgi:uncharacterized membrane protein